MKTRSTRQKELLDTERLKIKTFFSAEGLYETVSKKDNKLGMATIYRYLKALRKEGLIYSYTCDGKNIYSNNKSNHCHFECEETGEIIHFDIENIDFLKNKIPGEITSFQLEVKGICKNHN
jgi:Fe2+ or Zn2+ uptake regulation protein